MEASFESLLLNLNDVLISVIPGSTLPDGFTVVGGGFDSRNGPIPKSSDREIRKRNISRLPAFRVLNR